jgi:hypothetical protein
VECPRKLPGVEEFTNWLGKSHAGIDGQVKSAGKVLPLEEIKKLL